MLSILKPKTLNRAFLLIIVPSITILTALVFSSLELNMLVDSYKDLKINVSSIAENQAKVFSRPLWNVNYERASELSSTLLENPDIVGIAILDENNELFTVGGALSELSQENVFSWTDKYKDKQYDVYEYISIYLNFIGFRHKKPEYYMASSQIFLESDYGSEFIGTIFILVSDENLFGLFKEDFRKITISSIFVLFSMVFSSLLAQRYTVGIPLRRLKQQIKKAEKSSRFEYGCYEADKITENEIDYLSNKFKQLWNNQELNKNKLQSNIAELEEIKEALRVKNEILEKLTSSARDAIIQIDGTGKMIFWNHAAMEMFGYREDEAIGMHVRKLMASNDMFTRFQKHYPAFKNSGRGQTIGKYLEFTALKKDGSSIPVELSVSSFQHNDEWQAMALVRDISLRKKEEQLRLGLERQLHQSHKMEAVGTMAGGIAHDFNNLLSIIIGNLDLISNRLDKGDATERNIEHIKSASARAKDLVNQILTFSRQESQNLVPVSLSTITTDTLRLLRATFPASVEIFCTVEHDTIAVKADKTQLQQVIINLCSNAVHAMDEKGLLSIKLKGVDHTELKADNRIYKQKRLYAMLSVTDTGCGMDQETIDRVFEPFFTTKKVGAGTGMGLSVTHGVVEQHGGFITIDSALGKGTTFNVYLPITEETEVTPHKEIKSLPTGTERILFVDDEECIAYTCNELLECQGYTVTSVTSSVEALELFKASPHEFDLVITDQTMPEMTGVDLVAELLKVRADIPVILCSGYSATVSEQVAKKNGVREFCMKPMDMNKLATVARKVLDENDSSR